MTSAAMERVTNDERPNEPEYLTAREAGKLLRVTAWKVYELARSKKLPAYSVAGGVTLRGSGATKCSR